MNNFDDLNCFYYSFIARGVTVYIFGHGNSNKLVHRATDTYLANGVLAVIGGISIGETFSSMPDVATSC